MFVLQEARVNTSTLTAIGLLYLSCLLFPLNAAQDSLEEITDQDVISTLVEYPPDAAHELCRFPTKHRGTNQLHLVPPANAFLNFLIVKISDKSQPARTYRKVISQVQAKQIIGEAVFSGKHIKWFISGENKKE